MVDTKHRGGGGGPLGSALILGIVVTALSRVGATRDSLLRLAHIQLDRQYLLQLSVGVWICISIGADFCFGIFSPYLHHPPFDFTQSQVNAIATAGAMATFFTPPVGFVFDRFGPSVTLAVGAALNLVGWAGLGISFLLAAASLVAHKVPAASTSIPTTITSGGAVTSGADLPGGLDDVFQHVGSTSGSTAALVVMMVAFTCSQMASPFYEQGSVLANLQGLSTHRGKVVLIQKTFMGLGSGIISEVYSSFFVTPHSGSGANVVALRSVAWFCFAIGAYSVIVGVLGALVTNVPRGPESAHLRVAGINNAPIMSETMNSSFSDDTSDDEEVVVVVGGGMVSGGSHLRPPPPSRTRSPLLDPATNQVDSSQYHVRSPSTTTTTTTMRPLPSVRTVPSSSSPGGPSDRFIRRFQRLLADETNAARHFDRFFGIASKLTVFIMVLVALIAIVDTYWISKIGSPDGSPAFNNWQWYSAILTMLLCTLYLPFVYLVKPRGATDVALRPGELSSLASNGAGGGDGCVVPMATSGINNRSQEDGDGATTATHHHHHHRPASTALQNVLKTVPFTVNSHPLLTNLLSSPNWWCIWFQCFAVWGAATLVNTNSSQILYALNPSGYTETSNAAMVSIFGVASAAGRAAVGALDGIVQKWKVQSSNALLNSTAGAAPTTPPTTSSTSSPRTVGILSAFFSRKVAGFRSRQADELVPVYFLLIPSALLCVGLPLFLVATPGMLLLCFFIVGLAAGFTYGSVILIVSTFTSQEHAGKHYGFVGSAGFATPILFNIVIFGQSYDAVGALQPNFVKNNNQCVGMECLMTPMLMCTALSGAAFLVMIEFVRRVLRDGHI